METPEEKAAREKREIINNTRLGKLAFLVILGIIFYALILQNNINIKFVGWSILILIIIGLLIVVVSLMKLCIDSVSENL